MSFSRSGSVITQTGTDTDLSGITSSLGASNIFSNGGTAPLDRTVYDLATPNYRLVINGTLSVDPANEELWLPGTVNALDIGSSGTLNLGGSRSFSGGVSYSKEQAIFFDLRGSSHVAGSNAWMRCQGTFNWDGGVVTVHAAVDVLEGGTINAGTLRQGIQLSSSSASSYACFLTDCTINDLLIDGRTRLVIRDANVNINGITLLHTAGLFAAGNGGAALLTSFPPVSNYDRQFVEKDYTFWRGGKLRLRNSSIGSNAICTGNDTASANNTGCLEIQQEFTLTVVDSVGSPITSGLWFIRDYDNGNRQNDGYNGGGSPADNSLNLTADKTYNASFNGSGTHSPVVITTAYANRTDDDTNGAGGSTAVGTYDVAPNRYDRRTKNDVAAGVNLDEMDVFVWSYEYLPATLTPSLIGLGGTEVTTTLFDDTNVTETNQTTVDAYSTINTLARLYDRAKSYKTVLANVEFPAADQQVINAGGANVSLNIDAIVIGSSGSAFSVNTGTSTLTINAGTLAPGGAYDTLVIGAGQSGSITGTATLSANLNVAATGDFTLADIADLTGTLTLAGDLEVTGTPTGTFPTGTVASTGKIVLSGSGGGTMDAQSLVFDASSTIENTSGSPITVQFSPGQQQPTKLETSGTLTFENAPVTITVTAFDVSGSPVENARVFIQTDPGGVEIINALTNASGIATTTTSESGNITGRVRKASAGDNPKYRTSNFSGEIDAGGFTTIVLMLEDQ